MSVALKGAVIRLGSPVRIEDAERLVSLLLEDRRRAVDWTASGPLHSAVVQALLTFRPPVVGLAGDPFTQDWVVPALDGVKSP